MECKVRINFQWKRIFSEKKQVSGIILLQNKYLCVAKGDIPEANG